MSIRSGRFRFPNTTAAGSVTLVKTANKKHAGSLYRVLNSGESSLDVYTTGGTKRTILENNSVDLLLADGGDLMVEWSAPTAAKNIQGIYIFLGDENGSMEALESLRSGRFTGIPTNETRVIADLSQGSSKSGAFYRLFNSGNADVTFSGTGLAAFTLKAGFSIDVALAPRGILQVDGTAEVDVIYDLLGGVGA